MKRQGIAMLVGVALLAATATQAPAEPLALASCAKFTSAKDVKEALYGGYIYGFLAARIGYRDAKRLTDTALKVKAAALNFCRRNQDATFVTVVEALTAEAAKKSRLPAL
ncbi:hypothetical protein CWB41_12460 [Methylovirgula ligni]|uniref:HdeA/HdeB family protein n=1 Tax=Methylovirgula ligni TaxID=569860 RepID=A0A3D9YT82_9HYPH|nr:hypothetical protein [Methylovirgula ligni]QAY96442.1 hypothetical protein CWB41_12460 [Methylovirgula ligni]REF85827.1 hypothetical protein DES32_1863 [Methylovirgula ligni]